MKIVCEHCSARYQIKDDKVKDKAFKIRCKRCQHVIVVDPAANRQVAPEEPQAQPTGSASENLLWYAAINDTQAGPFHSKQLEAKFKQGQLDQESFVWREGMNDWLPVKEISELAFLLAQPSRHGASQPRRVRQEQTTPAALSTPQPEADHAQSVSPFVGMAKSQEPKSGERGRTMERTSLNASAPAAAPSATPMSHANGESLFSSADPSAASQRSRAESTQEDGQSLKNQRNENSVLFSLDQLGASEAELQIHNPSRNERSGLIDLASLTKEGASPLSMSTALPAQRTVIPRRVSPIKLATLSILGAGTVLAAGLYLYQKLQTTKVSE